MMPHERLMVFISAWVCLLFVAGALAEAFGHDVAVVSVVVLASVLGVLWWLFDLWRFATRRRYKNRGIRPPSRR